MILNIVWIFTGSWIKVLKMLQINFHITITQLKILLPSDCFCKILNFISLLMQSDNTRLGISMYWGPCNSRSTITRSQSKKTLPRPHREMKKSGHFCNSRSKKITTQMHVKYVWMNTWNTDEVKLIRHTIKDKAYLKDNPRCNYDDWHALTLAYNCMLSC